MSRTILLIAVFSLPTLSVAAGVALGFRQNKADIHEYLVGRVGSLVRASLAATFRSARRLAGPLLRFRACCAANVITPKITGHTLVLLHDPAVPGDVSSIELTFDHSAATPATDAKASVTQSGAGSVELFTDSTLATALVGPFEIGKKAIYLKGSREGEVVLSVNVANSLPEIRGGKTEYKLYVAKLKIEVHEHDDFDVQIAGTNWVTTREVYQFDDRYGPGVTQDVFPRILARITQPANELWTYASRVDLSFDATVGAFGDGTGVTAYRTCVDNDTPFDGGHEHVHVIAYADGAEDPEFDTAQVWTAPAPSSVPNPSVATACTRRCRPIALSVTSRSGETLKKAAVIELRAYSFDQDLDRLVRAECWTRLNGDDARDQATALINRKDVAIAKAAGHRRLPRPTSAFRVNWCHDLSRMAKYVAFRKKRTVLDKLAFIEHVYFTDIKEPLDIRTRAAIESLLKSTEYTNDEEASLCGIPGLHAEVIAVNDLLRAGVASADITVATYKLKKGSGRGGRFATCRNCNWIFRSLGVRGISGWEGLKVDRSIHVNWVGRGF